MLFGAFNIMDCFSKYINCLWDFPGGSVSSVAQSCPTLCDSMDCSTPGFPVHHQIPELASLVAQMVKNLPAVWETWVRILGYEDALEESMASRSNILAWRIPWTEESGGLQSIGSQRVRADRATNAFTVTKYVCGIVPWCSLMWCRMRKSGWMAKMLRIFSWA